MTMTSLFTSFWLAQAADADSAAKGTSFMQFIYGGGIIGYVIIGLSIAALAMAIIHLIQIRRTSLLPATQIDMIDSLLARGDVNGAMEYCVAPANDSFITRIMAAGLARYQKSAFGAFEVKTAIEEAGEEQTARLYRSTDALGVIGSIAPLLGLLGTVQGMIGAFETVSKSAVNNANYYESLASNISLALITTFQGLVVAIPCVALFTFFRNRIDAFASEAGSEVERLVIHLESAPTSLPPTTGAARPPMRHYGGPMSGGPGGQPSPPIPPSSGGGGAR